MQFRNKSDNTSVVGGQIRRRICPPCMYTCRYEGLVCSYVQSERRTKVGKEETGGIYTNTYRHVHMYHGGGLDRKRRLHTHWPRPGSPSGRFRLWCSFACHALSGTWSAGSRSGRCRPGCCPPPGRRSPARRCLRTRRRWCHPRSLHWWTFEPHTSAGSASRWCLPKSLRRGIC